MPTLTTVGGNITYSERPNSPMESYKGQMYTVQRVFDVAWGDRWTFALALLGDSQVITAVDAPYGAYVSRTIPQGYRTQLLGPGTNDRWMFPVSIDSMEPIGADVGYDANDVAQYTRGDAKHAGARITVSYEGTHYKVFTDADMLTRGYVQTDPYTGLTNEQIGDNTEYPDESSLGRYCSVFVQPMAEYLSLPFNALKWVEINDKANNDPGMAKALGNVAQDGTKTYAGANVTNSYGRIIPSTEVNVTWHMVPKVPSAMYTGLGKVNAGTFTDPYDRFTAAPGQLLLTNAELKPYRWIGGKYLFDISYKFKLFKPAPQPGDPGYNAAANHDLFNQDIPGHITNNHFLHFRIGAGGFNSPPVFRLLTDTGLPPPTNTLAVADQNVAADTRPGSLLYPYMDFTLLFSPV